MKLISFFKNSKLSPPILVVVGFLLIFGSIKLQASFSTYTVYFSILKYIGIILCLAGGIVNFMQLRQTLNKIKPQK